MATQGFARFEVTLVTQLSLDRLQQLRALARAWDGPISAAVFIKEGQRTNSSGTEKVLREIRAEGVRFCFLEQQSLKAAVRQYYPVNKLRNMALAQVDTEFLVLIDADFAVSVDLAAVLRRHTQRLDWSGPLAVVVPAFELTVQSFTDNAPQLKVSMARALKKRQAVPFQSREYPSGHFSTDNRRWVRATQPYEVPYRYGYEPFVMLRRPVPRFDEYFVGYGQNKISHIYELAAAQFRFVVVPDAFIVHTFDESEAFKKQKDWTVGWSCWREFAERIERRYGYRPTEPCWVSQVIWPKVNKERGLACVSNPTSNETAPLIYH